MKSKWMYISIALLLMLIGSLYYNIILSNKKTEKITEYSCSGITKVEKGSYPLNINQKFKVDNTGTIIENVSYVTYEYDSKETYEAAKKIYQELKDSEYTYEYDNDNYKIISVIKKESTTLKDAEGVEVSVWYKDYIKSLEKQNYTCKKLNS